MRFAVLDSWRGLAALFVALFHLNAYGYFYSLPLVRNSFLFVDFFFVLSGFIIAHTYLDRLNGSSDLFPFVIRRFGRVWPLHAVMLALFVAFPLSEFVFCSASKLCGSEWPFRRDDLGTALSNVFLLHSMGLHDHLSWNWPSWSISVEFYAYVLFAVACIAVRPILVPFSLTLVLVSVSVLVLFSTKYIDATYDFGYFRCLFGFFLGFLTFMLYRESKIRVGRWATPLELVTVLGVGTFLSVVGVSTGTFLAPLVFACCVYVFAHEAGPISRILQSKAFLSLGTWSYSLYMVHAFILIVLTRMASGIERLYQLPIRVNVEGYSPKLYYFHDRYVMDILAMFYLLTVIALASFTYRRVEDPARRFFNRIALTVSSNAKEPLVKKANN